jgi:isopropylmalate/homocitrate/citramalate synthase
MKNMEITPQMTDGTDFKQSLEKHYCKHIHGISSEELKDLLTWIFWLWVIQEKKEIKITDVTLREWDQAPLTSFNANEKKFVYLMLRELWVDTIEVWFPAWKTDFKNIQELVDFFGDDPNPPFISVLWRAVDFDNERSLEVLENAKKIRIHTFIATSEAHIFDKFCKGKYRDLGEGKEFVKNSIKEQIKKLKNKQEEIKNEGREMVIEFSPEDATNTKYDFLLECVRIAIESWANVINVPDTLGISDPDTYKTLFYLLSEDTKNLKEKYSFEFSTHVHNDKWLALATALWWVKWWAKTIESTLLGIGERTWNTPTGQVILNSLEWGNISIKNIKTFLLSSFSEAVRKIIWDDMFNREPWIGKNAQSDGSWVHNANPWVYGWSKNYLKMLWVIAWEKYFSPRGWKNNIYDLLCSLGFDGSKFNQEIIEKLVGIEAEKAEISRKQYPSQIYKDYLEQSWKLSDFNYELFENEKKVIVKFNLFWENIKIEEDLDWENSYIEALIRWFKRYLWNEWEQVILQVYFAQEKPYLSTVIEETKKHIEKTIVNDKTLQVSDYFNKKIDEILEKLERKESEKSTSIIHFWFEIDWKERNSLTYGTNVEKATIEAIFWLFLPEIVKKNDQW